MGFIAVAALLAVAIFAAVNMSVEEQWYTMSHYFFYWCSSLLHTSLC